MHKGRRYSLYGLGSGQSNSDKQKAELLAQVISADILEGRFDPTLAKYKAGLRSATKTFTTLTELFADWIYALKPSDKTYNQHYSWIHKALLKHRPKLSDFDWIRQEWEHVSATTYNERIGYLRRFGEWLKDEGYLSHNHYRNLKPKPNDRKQVEPFTTDEVRAILTALRNRSLIAAHFYRFLFLTGCRPSEAIGLTWDKVDWNARTITIDSALARSDSGSSTAKARVRKPTKTHDVRVFPISVALEKLLVESNSFQQDTHLKTELVFSNSYGTALDDRNLLKRYWKPTLDQLGITYRQPYAARHTAASMLIENGGTLADAARLLGHKDLKMVASTYGHAMKSLQLPSYD